MYFCVYSIFLVFYWVVQQVQCWWKPLKNLSYQFLYFSRILTRLYLTSVDGFGRLETVQSRNASLNDNWGISFYLITSLCYFWSNSKKKLDKKCFVCLLKHKFVSELLRYVFHSDIITQIWILKKIGFGALRKEWRLWLCRLQENIWRQHIVSLVENITISVNIKAFFPISYPLYWFSIP